MCVCVCVYMSVCVCVPHLQAGDGEAAGVIGQRGDGDDEGAVWDVLVVELDGDLVVACTRQATLLIINRTLADKPSIIPLI